jgi:3-phenylpropionate/trans-cinnamate dioxygenase ferredoxin subunit
MCSLGTWHRLASVSDLRDNEGFPADLDGTPVALYRIDGKVHAIDDTCTHEFANLSEGFVESGTVECPLHAAQFEIATGKCLSGPAMTDLKTYPVRIEGDDIYVSTLDA